MDWRCYERGYQRRCNLDWEIREGNSEKVIFKLRPKAVEGIQLLTKEEGGEGQPREQHIQSHQCKKEFGVSDTSGAPCYILSALLCFSHSYGGRSLTAQTHIHLTATHLKHLSIFLLSLIMAQVQPRNARVLMLSPTPTPTRQPSTAGHRSWSINVSASPPLGEHHWETFCTLLSRSQQKIDMLLTTAISKTVLFVFSPPFLSRSSHALTPFGSLTCPPTTNLPLSHFKGTQSRIHTH